MRRQGDLATIEFKWRKYAIRLRPRADAPGRWAAMQHSWDRAGCEPAVEEMLSDPIVQLLAQRDGLSTQDLRLAVTRAERALASRRSQPVRRTPEELLKA
jgi:hypothetical protein